MPFIQPDQMTPLERMTAFSKGEPIDRIPCCPFSGESFAPYFGHSLALFNHSSEIIADTVIRTFQLFRPDNCSIGPGLQGLPEAMGCTLHFPEYGIPSVVVPALERLEDMDSLPRINPYRHGRLNLFLEALKTIQETVGHEVSPGSTVGGPFTTAAFLLGIEKFLKAVRQNPQGVHRLLKIVTENTLAYMDAVMDLGITPGIADPIASCTVVSPTVYQAFAKPYTRRCEAHIIKRMGSGGAMHICGKTQGIWQDMIDTGITALSLDNQDDIEQLKNAHGHQVTIVGNVDPVDTILNGTREDIYEAVRICIEKAKDSPKGFILATGCDVPIGTDPQRVLDFMDGARIYGRMK